MDKNNLFGDDNLSQKPSPTKIDDFAKNIKENTMNFLSNERSEKSEEKSDAEKPKVDVDDFLNFNDDFSQPKQPDSPVLLPSIEKKNEIIEEPKVVAQPEPEHEPEIDFHAIDDEYLNPYASPTSKGFETQNEKFISSEDLLTDFKDPTPAPVEKPAEVEIPKPAPIVKPPVTEPIKPVVEPPKPKSAPPPAPVKQTTSDDTQIEAEKIFKSIGLGE